jgi:signal transduction histidine kinase
VTGLAIDMLYTARMALEAIMLLLALGGTGLVVAHRAADKSSQIGPLSRQFAVSVAITIGLILLAVTVTAEFFFVSSRDAIVISIVVVFVGVIAVRAALLMSNNVLDGVESVRDGIRAVGEGKRDLRIPISSSDELAQLAACANVMIEQLVAEENARQQLVAAVSHDLRTPITSLRLLAEAVDDDIVDDETRKRYFALMRTHINALLVMIEDLFELTRLQAGEESWSRQAVDVEELVRETADAMVVQAETKHIKLSFGEQQLNRWQYVDANPEKVQRVLFNLIQNAIRHTPENGRIEVSLSDGEDGFTVIEVADSGSGIAPKDREQIFAPFFRGGGDACRHSEGAGLGLAVSRALVEAHGGRIWVGDSEQGARLRFSLPCIKTVSETTGEEAETEAETEKTLAYAGG